MGTRPSGWRPCWEQGSGFGEAGAGQGTGRPRGVRVWGGGGGPGRVLSADSLGRNALPCHWAHGGLPPFLAGTPRAWWAWLPAASQPLLKALSPAPCPCPTACPRCPTHPTPLLPAKPSSPRRIETIRVTSCSAGGALQPRCRWPGLGQAPAEEAPLGGGGTPETVLAPSSGGGAGLPALTSPVLRARAAPCFCVSLSKRS